MTALVLNWLTGASLTTKRTDERVLVMKGLLLGMLVCMAAGAETLILIPDGPLTLQQQFVFGLICGTIGTVVGVAMFDIPTAKALARQAVANLGLAALLAPTVARGIALVTGMEVTIVMIAPIAGLLGISGTVILAKVLPMIIDAIARRARKEIQQLLPDDEGK